MTKSQLEIRRTRIRALNHTLKKLFPDAHIALHYKTQWELLVAVELSAQCTDKKVNQITERLFKKYKTLDAYVNANPREFERDIHAAGFYRAKTKNILAAAQMLKKDFGGRVPRTMAQMLLLPGVARKTANVVLGNAFGVVEGIAVDTHVIRFITRYNLSDYHDPVHIEQDLMQLLPKKEWLLFTYRVISYGRTIAPARKYDVDNDPLIKIYPPAAKRFRV